MFERLASNWCDCLKSIGDVDLSEQVCQWGLDHEIPTDSFPVSLSLSFSLPHAEDWM